MLGIFDDLASLAEDVNSCAGELKGVCQEFDEMIAPMCMSVASALFLTVTCYVTLTGLFYLATRNADPRFAGTYHFWYATIALLHIGVAWRALRCYSARQSRK